jgi:hypothetical protein
MTTTAPSHNWLRIASDGATHIRVSPQIGHCPRSEPNVLRSPRSLFHIIRDTAESGQVNFFATIQGGFIATLVVIDQPILFYVDAGQNPIVNIQPASGFDITTPALAQGVNLSGYMVDCSDHPCSAMFK